MRFVPDAVASTVTEHPIKTLGSVAGILGLLALWRYQGAIRRRIKMVREESWIFGAGVTMERTPTKEIQQRARKRELDSVEATAAGVFSNLRLLELNPDFRRRQEEEGWSLLTLGEYMSSLRPKQLPKNVDTRDMPALVRREIESGLSTGLLKALGPNLGRALLPAVGIGPIQSAAKGLASAIATKWFLGEGAGSTMSETEDKGGLPIGLMALLAAADLNAKVNSGNKDGLPGDMKEAVPNFNLSAVEKMSLGEVVRGPSFVDADHNLLPAGASNNFVLDTDFDQVVRKMEERLGADVDYRPGHVVSPDHQMAQEVVMDDDDGGDKIEKAIANGKQWTQSNYDPEDRSMAAPVAVNERLFPDLHIGWGDAKCSHTKREVLKMRLLCILLNRLGSNYAKRASGGAASEGELFSVQMDSNDSGSRVTTPSGFVQALIETGHKIQVVPSSRLTTFGVGLCVKEPDNLWTNIPLGVFLESGYEDKDGNMAPAMMPHSGLDMYISGPLAGKRADGTPSNLRIQHFIGIEGFCGWKSHESVEVPFNEGREAVDRLEGKDAVRAARLAGLYANVLNGLATDLKLPFGGYGLTSVCNDSAAVVQQCLYGKNTIYPMTSIGRYMQRTLRFAQGMREQMKSQPDLEVEVEDLCAIIQAMKKLPNDIISAPANALSAAERMLQTIQPKLPFVLNVDSQKVMQSILEEEKKEETSSAKASGLVIGSQDKKQAVSS
jgi:hypothetical protein